MNRALEAVRDWLVGFVGRLWFAVKLAALLPVLFFLFLISPVWWLITGRECASPRWVDRMLDWGY